MIPYAPYPRRSYRTPAPAPAPAAVSTPAPATGAPDLQSQLEGLLDAVWRAEADWRFNDRLDIALKTRRDSLAA